jgi:protein TonB
VAPIEVPSEIKPEEALDLGIEGGVVGGVEGGVPGGVVGGVVGGLPTGAPPPPARVVRIGGQIAQPRIIRKVEPVYPDLAIQSRIGALVILEAEVDVRGHVKNVKVLRGHPLFDESAMQAVKQWRYQPLLLNGEPTGFILTVTVTFNLRAS